MRKITEQGDASFLVELAKPVNMKLQQLLGLQRNSLGHQPMQHPIGIREGIKRIAHV